MYKHNCAKLASTKIVVIYSCIVKAAASDLLCINHIICKLDAVLQETYVAGYSQMKAFDVLLNPDFKLKSKGAHYTWEQENTAT